MAAWGLLQEWDAADWRWEREYERQQRLKAEAAKQAALEAERAAMQQRLAALAARAAAEDSDAAAATAETAIAETTAAPAAPSAEVVLPDGTSVPSGSAPHSFILPGVRPPVQHHAAGTAADEIPGTATKSCNSICLHVVYLVAIGCTCFAGVQPPKDMLLNELEYIPRALL